MNFLSITLMLSLASATLVSDPSLEMSRCLLQKKNRKNQISGRKLEDSSTCPFEAFVASKCTIEDYCSGFYEFLGAGESISCSRNVDSTWYIRWTYPEHCGNDVKDWIPYDAKTFDPETDYCSIDKYFQHFTATGVYTHDDYTETVTRPAEGTVRQGYAFNLCNEYEAEACGCYENWGGLYYCVVPCPEVLEINGMACEKECGECPDDKDFLTVDCTGVDPNLFEECTYNYYDFVYKVLAYFEGTIPPKKVVPDESKDDTVKIFSDAAAERGNLKRRRLKSRVFRRGQ
jgi:hypothetical protein